MSDERPLKTHTINADMPPFAGRARARRRGADSIDPYPTWGALRWLFLFRLLMVVGLILAFSPATLDPSIPYADAQLAWNILAVYALLVLASGIGLSRRWPRRPHQVQSAIVIDILTYTVLMHAAGGVTSGIGILLAVTVAASALMMEGRLSLLFAALASLAVIAQQVYAVMLGDSQSASFTQAGLLGLLFFVVALLSHVLYRRVRTAEALAAQRKVDIDDLAKLNGFIIHSIGTGILAVDGERRLRLLNQAALNLLGAAPFRTGDLLSDLSPELAAWVACRFQSDAPPSGLIEINERAIHVSMKLLGERRAAGLILYLRDNQEVVKEVQQMKLAALGTLTASIAHNIRNPLSAITHASQLLVEGQGLSDDDRHLLDIIRRNSARIEETVQSVLQLSRRHQRDPCRMDLNDWLEDFASEFRERHGLSESVFQLQFDSPRIAVTVDPRHLHQILANLCENAVIHGGADGRSVQILIRSSQSADQHEPLVEVIDDGPGIDAATANDIFNPFYTTRIKGTGLGLYIARELAETNGVQLKYMPVEPHGSCFRLLFSNMALAD
ncbi:sensor histidine kinase [Thiobaca trueperi]|uniref:histidine kinase n=1 Tax=Thiobaca trueperi TaxID=127458 RepID=A0A4R3MUP1_9GAMM|nr:signal transduction histidine kinase [Thiobaca trueperi]